MLPRSNLFDAAFHRRGQQYFQHVRNSSQQLMTEMTVVNQRAVVGDFTKSGLKGDAVGCSLAAAAPTSAALFPGGR